MTLREIAKVIRSKNAGPYIVTFDVFFPNSELFNRVRGAGLFTPSAVAVAFNISEGEIIGFKYYPFANAVKFSLRRPVVSGSIGDSDVYGAQQHAPLLEMDAT